MLSVTHSVNLFLQKLIQEILHDHHASTCGRPLCNLRFADDIDLIGSNNGEIKNFTNRLIYRARAYEIEVSIEKSKIMTNSTNDASADILTNGQKLEEVTNFKYMGATLCKNGTCSAEIRIRIAVAVAAMTRLNRIWQSNTISFASKFKLYKSLVISILFYG